MQRMAHHASECPTDPKSAYSKGIVSSPKQRCLPLLRCCGSVVELLLQRVHVAAKLRHLGLSLGKALGSIPHCTCCLSTDPAGTFDATNRIKLIQPPIIFMLALQNNPKVLLTGGCAACASVAVWLAMHGPALLAGVDCLAPVLPAYMCPITDIGSSQTHVHSSRCSSAAFLCAAAAAAGSPSFADSPLPFSPAAAAATAAALSLLISRFWASRNCPLKIRTCKAQLYVGDFN